MGLVLHMATRAFRLSAECSCSLNFHPFSMACHSQINQGTDEVPIHVPAVRTLNALGIKRNLDINEESTLKSELTVALFSYVYTCRPVFAKRKPVR